MNRWMPMLAMTFLISCASLPKQEVSYSAYNKIACGPGPEDLLVDSVTTYDRLLISCDERRVGETNGSFWEYNFATKQSRELKVILPDTNYSFHPHGIDILETENGAYLYVVNHWKEPKVSEIIRLVIYQDSLVYDEEWLDDGFPESINDVFAVSERDYYYSNDKLVNGRVFHHKNGKESLPKMKYPNGVHMLKDTLYVSTTFGNKVYQCFKNEKGNWKKKKIAKVRGGDNFTEYNNNLLVTSHPKYIKFIKHYKKSSNYSPSVVYQIDTKTKKKKTIYSNKGEQISACSTGLIYKGKLYLAQVFEPFLLECEP